MVKLSDNGFTGPPAKTEPTLNQKQSPSLSKDEIAKSLKTRGIGPRHGKMFVGKGGLKPYRRPADGDKLEPINYRTRKPLRAPQQRNT